MVDTDWKEILSFSQKELKQSDKDKLCESLSWMEADDIELNFTDLKTLFRLAQDILKYKSEQVNNLLGQLETSQRKIGKGKSKSSFVESPTKSSDSILETIAHQEEVIKANKEILEQLYADITELERRKGKLEEDRDNVDRDSESSRDVLSEMNAMAQLENEVTMKNRHIRKLLGDVKVLEEENSMFKEKISVLNDKLTEATELIENLTEQLFSINSENKRFKETLGKSEQAKVKLSNVVESLQKELSIKDSAKENIYEEIKSKVQHWKNIARAKKAEIEALSSENTKLKENLIHASQLQSPSPKAKQNQAEKLKIKELQEKLSEASREIIESANIINLLKAENKQLKATLVDTPDFSISDTKNESDDGKERALINKLKTKVKNLTVALQGAEEMIAIREKELSEIASQLQLLKTDEGINALLESLKSKKRKLKTKDDGIKSLVQEVNTLSQLLDNSQLENEAMRQKLNIPVDEKIPVKGILKRHREMEQNNVQLIRELRKYENKLVSVELDNRSLNVKLSKLIKHLETIGYDQEKIDELCEIVDIDEDITTMPIDGGGEASTIVTRQASQDVKELSKREKEMQVIVQENEGLRKSLQEMLDFLKDNSSTTSGVLTLQCPSLETVLNSMEARHAAGWFAPHMAAVMELKAALGGKDALLTALHEARKETFEVMKKLSKETEKSKELEQKLNDVSSRNEELEDKKEHEQSTLNTIAGEFGTWMTEKEQQITDFGVNRIRIEDIVKKGNMIYEDQLKNGLIYFHNKFKTLFEKTSSIIIQTTDDQNKWAIQEEKYKAEIENLKLQISQNIEDSVSDTSPGLVSIPSVDALQRKCSYLEESYKHIRTVNENMKTEYLESKKDAMIMSTEYETEIQKLILAVANLTDKLRGSISIELFWEQNKVLNNLNTKYRQLLEFGVQNQTASVNLFKRLDDDKIDILNNFRKYTSKNESNVKEKFKIIMSNIEQTVLSKQLQQVCSELDDKNNQIENLEGKIAELQETQSKLIDETLAGATKAEVKLFKEQLEKLTDEHKIVKEQCQHVESQLDIALLQLQDSQQRQMSNDIEINMLRHQILDLQSIGDNKAIVARLSGEVLVAHIQASENHKRIERLTANLNKEKQQKFEVEEMLRARQKIFEVYALKFEAKFRYMNEIMQVLRQQYQGSLPLISLESYLNNAEEISRKTHDVNEKLNEIEDLQSTLMMKHSIFDQVLDVSKNKCLEDEDSCPHKLKYLVLEGVHSRELDHYKKQIATLEISRKEILKRCDKLEKTLILTNQGFEKTFDVERRGSILNENDSQLEIEDIQSDDESDSRKSRTVTLPKPQILKSPKKQAEKTQLNKDDSVDVLLGSPVRAHSDTRPPEVVNVSVQTSFLDTQKTIKSIQTDGDKESDELKKYIENLENHIDKINKDLSEAIKQERQQNEEILILNKEKKHLEAKLQVLNEYTFQKDKQNESLRATVDDLRHQIEESRNTERNRFSEVATEENKTLLAAVKMFERDKNKIIEEYKELLNKEREEYAKSVKILQVKVMELQTQLDSKASDTNVSSVEAIKEDISKYVVKIAELEDKLFKSQNSLDECKRELLTYQTELDRWKGLASERLTKMEQLNSQLEERHCHEVESYKAENDHWLSQLNETQREHLELRSRLTEQKATFVKQLADKDSHIEQLRSVVHGLKTQILTMQAMISIEDPSFDLSAIVEVEEASDASQHGSERLQLKYDSSVDLQDTQDDLRMSTSTTIWQEPVIERLRREKQLTGKQNAMLRRQIKALAARERRSRLDAQNLKNQIFRISTSGSKVATAEVAALHNKIASLQAQLISARRDTHSTVALWDKCKRAQQTAERWQARYEEKCVEIKKLEASVSLAKSAISRLEREKRVLLARIAEVKSEKVLVVEKQDSERSEKVRTSESAYESPPVSARALLERVQAQQRRIVALEAADKGNEYLVSEYEKALAEITSLKGQVLKLESTLLESQIRIPLKSNQEQDTELEYWKSYCEMLKEENVQLNLKVSSIETVPASANHQRVNDLEQTVLTLRGLVSKLQSEHKSTGVKRPDSRPSSGRSGTDKNRTNLESHRIEIANLKRSIQDKDLLLERSKEMLKIAAEREDDLLRENSSLRRQIDELAKHGFLSE